MIDLIDFIYQLPFWLKSHILKYYICGLKPSDLIHLYANGFSHILEALSWQEWRQIYQNDPTISYNSYYGRKYNIPPATKGRYYLSFSTGGRHSHSLALRSDGKIIAWGHDFDGQCSNIPVLPKGTHYLSISAGYIHSLAITSDGQIVSWGNDGFGQCSKIPVLPKGTRYLAVSAGYYHSLAIRSDGQIVAWGNDKYGLCKKIPGLT